MILKIPGGLRPDERGNEKGLRFERLTNASAVCLRTGGRASDVIAPGTRVLRGTQIACVDGTPCYSPASGEFRGKAMIDGGEYLIVVSDGKFEPAEAAPEQKPLSEMTFEDVVGSLKRLAVYDTRSGAPLWTMMEELAGKCRRILVDCTESDPLSTASLRVCKSKAKEIAGGIKILMHAMSAGKAIIAAECDRDELFERINAAANGDFPLTEARLEVKYPYDDASLIFAVYVRDLPRGATAAASGCLTVSPETAAAVYECMAGGMPMLDRRISVCGKVGRPANFIVPVGMTTHDILLACGGTEVNSLLIENSRLNGRISAGSVQWNTRALIAEIPADPKRTPCIGCGACVPVCPARLLPFRSAGGRIERDAAKYCRLCGCCEAVCPSGIPLAKMFAKAKNELREREAQK